MVPPTSRPSRRRVVVRVLVAVAIPLLVVAAVVFQPWKLFVDRTVDEAMPAGETVVLARGTFVSQEHESSGSMELLRLADGSRVLRLNDLRTSDGPVLRVWLSDMPVVDGREGWFVFDDGRFVDLGDLLGNIGSSNYVLPPGVDVSDMRSVSIWCERFAVSFAAAPIVWSAP